MDSALLNQLRERTDAICTHWAALLRIEPANGPLANPDALVHLIPDSLARIFSALARPRRVPLTLATVQARYFPPSDCGNNPYLAYFIAAEQALVEALILIQATLPPTDRRESDLAELIHVTRRLARSEIDTFCSICAHRGSAVGCRHALAPEGVRSS